MLAIYGTALVGSGKTSHNTTKMGMSIINYFWNTFRRLVSM